MVLVRKLSLIPGVNFPCNGSTCYNINVDIQFWEGRTLVLTWAARHQYLRLRSVDGLKFTKNDNLSFVLNV